MKWCVGEIIRTFLGVERKGNIGERERERYIVESVKYFNNKLEKYLWTKLLVKYIKKKYFLNRRIKANI